MNKKLKAINIYSAIAFLLEAIFLLVFAMLYVFNVYNLQELVVPEIFAYLAIGLIIADVITVWIFIHVIHVQAQKNTVKSYDIVGADIGGAFEFGDIGIVVLDDDNVVMWASDLFKLHQIELVGKDIYEIFPNLYNLINSSEDGTAVFQYEDKFFDVKYLSAGRSLIFRDITQYKELDLMYKRESTVIGILMIDNYYDISGQSEEDNDLLSKVRTEIYDYAKEYNVLLRTYKNDAFFCVCNYESLLKMFDDHFSILEKVKKIRGTKEGAVPTLSIGFAYDFPDVNRLNRMASSAVDMATSRGGDQAVISQYGKELQFFGGRSLVFESKNKVKVRSVADSLLIWIRRAKNVLIMGHINMDMDALGAALGIKVMCDFCNKENQIVFELSRGEKKVNAVINSNINELNSRGNAIDSMTDEPQEYINSRTFITPKEALDKVGPDTLLVVVDVNAPSQVLSKEVLDATEKIVVIDHHRRAESYIENPVLSYVDPNASSASELVAELIGYASTNERSEKIRATSLIATIMMSGIFLDTSFFKSNTVGIRTFEASLFLEEWGADNLRADEWLKDDYAEYEMVTKIVATQKTPYTGIYYCAYTDDMVEEATLAKAANQCVQFFGVKASFAIARISDDLVKISARSDGTINVQLLMEKFAKYDGAGGGRFQMAACRVKSKDVNEVVNMLLDILEENLNEASVSSYKG